ncbi:hypothetical protein LTR53_009896 [Teratosphaeriaceae sp. CCFEE 6253]|nr:hypothetical protein LTR53_009896 [Teratosphaeriaceae sp. CCFEE 6253]
MPPKRAVETHPAFTFVNVDPAGVDRPRRTTQARAHTARIIRRRLRPQGDSQRVSAGSALDATESATGPAGHRSSTSSVPSHSSRSALNTRDEAESNEQPAAARFSTRPPSPRSLSPVFGALAVTAFDAGTSGAAVEAADYCLKVDWPNLLTPEEATVWFHTFCKHPVIFHGFNYASATHQDILRNRVSRSARRDMLAHKTQTFHLLRELVADVNDDNVELILFAVMIMWHYDLKDEEISDSGSLCFVPHMPGANWLSVYGRTTGVEAHTRPLMSLLDRAGGITQLKMPGLAFAISCGDLIAASIASEKPGLPLYWCDGPPIEELLRMLHIPPAECLGRGFTTQTSGGLTPEAESVLLELCAIDMLLGEVRLRRLKEGQDKLIVDVRNKAQYRLLSLPSWGELAEHEQTGRSRTIYELCLVTALLYSNAVIFPLPLNTGWHCKAITRLRGLVERSRIVASTDDISSMLLWCLFVGGIASFRSPDQAWFEMQLRIVLARAQLHRWRDVEQTLRAFLWSVEACRMGAAVLWDALGVEDESGSTSEVALRSLHAL